MNRTRSDCITPTSNPDAIYGLKSMDGVIPKLGIGAIRINSDIITLPKKGNNCVREKVPAANGRYVGLVLLFSTENGEPLAIMPDGVMQRMRVGAANGLGIKYLARKDASDRRHPRLRLAGGRAADGGLRSAQDRNDPLLQPHARHREAFAKQMSELLGVEVTPVAQPEEAIAGADIAMCATNSLDAIFFERWIEPGMHMSSIKLPEIEVKARQARRPPRLHVHDRSRSMSPPRISRSPKKANEHGWSAARRHRLRQAADPAGADHRPRRGPHSPTDEVTCFLNNIGLGYQFAAAGSVVYRKAKDTGLGHELPTEWFTEDVHP